MKQEYVQCKLVRELSGRPYIEEETSFIPKQFAIQDKILKIKNEFGKWEDGWRVHRVYGSSITGIIPDSHVAIKRHRKRTGDSMPKASK